MLKLLAEELKATDYTLTQSSLDQVGKIGDSQFLINIIAGRERGLPRSPGKCGMEGRRSGYQRFTTPVVYRDCLVSTLTKSFSIRDCQSASAWSRRGAIDLDSRDPRRRGASTPTQCLGSAIF